MEYFIILNKATEGFSPGDDVSGKIQIKLPDVNSGFSLFGKPDGNIADLQIAFEGKAKVKFTTRSMHQFKDKPSTKLICDRSLCDLDLNSLKQVNVKDAVTFTRKETFPSAICKIFDGPMLLENGVNEFSFRLTLPINIPSSLESKYGSIRYKLKLKYIQSKTLKTCFKVKIHIENRRTIDYLLTRRPALFRSTDYQLRKPLRLFLCKSHPMSLEINLSKSIYSVNEIISVNIQVDNTTNINISSFSVKFVERTLWIGKCLKWVCVKFKDLVLHEEQFEGIRKHNSKAWTATITVPSLPNLPVNLDSSQYIKIYSLIIVTGRTPCWCSDVTVLVPVEISSDQITI